MLRKYVIAVAAVMLALTPAAASEGKLKVNCNVQAKVYLNGIYVGETGSTISGLPTGEVRLKIAAEGFAPVERKITIPGGDAAEFEAVLKKQGEGQSTLGESAKSVPEPKPVEKKPVAVKPEDKKADEEKKEEDAPSNPVTEEEVAKVSKASDKARLTEILDGKSEYKVKLMAASALLRLKQEAGTDWIDGQATGGFRQTGKNFFAESPLTQGRKALESKRLAMVIKTKSAKIDTFEEVVAAYLVLLELEKRRQKVIVDRKNQEDKWQENNRGRGRRRGWRRANNQRGIIENFEEEEKLNHDLMKTVTSLLKKASRDKNKDMAALAKLLMKDANERINPARKSG